MKSKAIKQIGKDAVIDYLSGKTEAPGLAFDISFLSKKPPVKRIDTILEITKGKKVIHLGCADHRYIIDTKIQKNRHLHTLLINNCSKCLGIDIDNEAINYLKAHYKMGNLLELDIMTSDLNNYKEISSVQWDYLILGEILEHTDNPVAFLKSIKEKFHKYVENILITVPNAYGQGTVKRYYKKTIETLNSDHRYWFTPYTLIKVMYRSGIIFKKLMMADIHYKSKIRKNLIKLMMALGIRESSLYKTHTSKTLIVTGKLR
ncbi:MAG: hypothetical protein KAR38_12220 [Calditrichia bacterium]|nr:hypothetical protein [Calditrichia bacterium]